MNHMEDMLWSMTQESRTLQDLRKDIRGIWQDEAARELNGRYLDPHETEDQQMLAGLNRQKDALDQSRVELASAENSARQVEEYGTFVDEGLKSIEQKLQNLYENYETYTRYHPQARSKLPEIKKLLDLANSACIG